MRGLRLKKRETLRRTRERDRVNEVGTVGRTRRNRYGYGKDGNVDDEGNGSWEKGVY